MERKHRHLLEVARVLHFQANFPNTFWFDCIQCATHLVNRMPFIVLKNKIPYELLHKRKPSYGMLKCFGCLCFASTLNKTDQNFIAGQIPVCS